MKITSIEEVLEHSDKPISVDKVKNMIQDHHVYVIDTRKNVDFIGGHIPGAIWVPLEMSFAIWTAFVVDPTQGDKIILVTSEGKSTEAITRLSRTGLDCVIGYLEGGFEAWTKAGYEVEKTNVLKYESAEEFHERTADGHIVDVRNPGEWQDGVLGHASL